MYHPMAGVDSEITGVCAPELEKNTETPFKEAISGKF
jgi:hypothetical protein